jgi:transcriptional regulator with XRE-family HTH domain
MEQAKGQAARRTLARNLRRLRLARSLTQEQLAQAAHVLQAQISKMEAGKINARLDSLERIATALGVDLAELMQP